MQQVAEVRICCDKMRECVEWNDVFVTEGGKVKFPFDGPYDGREIIEFCPWCGKRIETKGG